MIDFDPPSTSKAPRPPRVTFNEELNSVVPVIAAREKGNLKPVQTDGSVDITGRTEMLARKNLRAMSENHRVILKRCEKCFDFLQSLSSLWSLKRVCDSKLQLPLQLH